MCPSIFMESVPVEMNLKQTSTSFFLDNSQADCQGDSDSKIDAIDTETDHFYMYIYKVRDCHDCYFPSHD